jgi:hypothetical protein
MNNERRVGFIEHGAEVLGTFVKTWDFIEEDSIKFWIKGKYFQNNQLSRKYWQTTVLPYLPIILQKYLNFFYLHTEEAFTGTEL